MFLSGAYDYANVLTRAADVSAYRNEVLSNNLANATTPGYKRKDVAFEESLARAIESAGTQKDSLTKKVHNLDPDMVRATVYTDRADLDYRIDENNVDVATENSELASNQLVYEALIDSINSEFSRIRSVIK